MVKIKTRYYLVELIPVESSRTVNIRPVAVFKKLLKLVEEMHGDYGFAAVRGSLQVKITDGDICLIRIETSAERFLSTVLPFVECIDSTPLVVKTLFVGRSIRSCQQKLIKIRRNELYALFGKAESGVERNTLLTAIYSVTGNFS